MIDIYVTRVFQLLLSPPIFSTAIPVPEKEYISIHSLLTISLVNGKAAVCKVRRKLSGWFGLSSLQHKYTEKKEKSGIQI